MSRAMAINRRDFIHIAALGTGAAAVGASGCARADVSAQPERAAVPPPIQALKPMTAGIVPIADDERRARIAKAQRLMAEQKIDAVFMEGTASCFYFANMRWGQSERTFGLVIPAKGELAYVCPKFEEERARELIKFGTDVRTWEEHESPYRLIAQIVRDRGLQHRRIGVEERVRFFIADGVRKEAAGMEIVDATPVTAGCRIYKSPAETALMQRANDVTIEAYRAALATMREGMTQGDLSGNIAAAFRALGFTGGASVQVGKWSALPHGSITPQTIHEGDIVMIDGGTSCEGYASDITRTTVLGKPTPRQVEVWNKEKEAQTAAFLAMKLGAACETVDAAARKVIEAAGFGPGYQVPGLPHRTGHGIGLEGHEWTNFVKGNTTPLAPGMCFSDEPMIAIPGEFGIRLEDCVYFDQAGAHFFTKQSLAINQPFG
ncbi:MAG TPA: Xaa-Pro peptidase family protein [Vicinamibacterales bacterium]|nr:Xaa-Pro peptidase family protein [Vicinamibacterales bacterium]